MYFTDNIDEITDIILNGGVVLLQVDTIFGLICDGLNKKAIDRVIEIKQRKKPSFGFFVRNLNIAKRYAEFNEKQENIFNKVFPGYFTLILKANEVAINKIPEYALGKINNTKTIGIRVPNSDFCLKLLGKFNTPLLATSANISGQSTATLFEEIDKTITESVNAVYYNKDVKIAGLSSTILDITDIDNCKIIRKGSGVLDF